MTDEWKLDVVESLKRTDKYAIRVEKNKRLLKLVFPLSEEQVWNENLLNTSDENNAKLVLLNQLVTVNDTLFYENAVKVDYPKENTFISEKEHIEVYQKNIGLTYLYKKDIEIQPNNPKIGEVWEQKLIENEE